MSIEVLTHEIRELHADARSAVDAAHEVAAVLLAVARRVNLATTYTAASRWESTLIAALEVLNATMEDLMSIESAVELVTQELDRLATLDNPAAAEARIRIGVTVDLVEIAGTQCIEYGNIAELAAQRVADFHEFETLTARTAQALHEGDAETFDRDIARVADLAAVLSTLDTEATLDALAYRRAGLDTD